MVCVNIPKIKKKISTYYGPKFLFIVLSYYGPARGHIGYFSNSYDKIASSPKKFKERWVEVMAAGDGRSWWNCVLTQEALGGEC